MNSVYPLDFQKSLKNLITIPDYYEPQPFGADDYQAHSVITTEIADIRERIQNELEDQQSELKGIVQEIIETFQNHYLKDTPILMVGAAVDEDAPLPLKRAVARLSRDVPLESMEIIKVLEYCVSEYKNNEMDPNFARDFALKLQYAPVVSNANLAGTVLGREFTPFVKKLRAINEPLQRLQDDLKTKENTLRSFSSPSSLLSNRMVESLNQALKKVQAEASRQVSRGDSAAAGVRGLCGELITLGITNSFTMKSLDRMVDGYTTIKEARENSSAKKPLKLIEDIIKAHLENLKLVSEPAFREEAIINAKKLWESKPPVVSAPKPEPKPEPKPNDTKLRQLLQTYISGREMVRDNNKIKEYFHGRFFAVFQKSYTQKKAAVSALLKALDGENVDLSQHLSTLRNGNLGRQLRSFIKEGKANDIVDAEVTTVRDFVHALQDKLSKKLGM